MLIALSLIPPNSPDQEFDVNLQDAVGRQILVAVEGRESKKGKMFYQIKGAEIFHLDDTQAKNYPIDPDWANERTAEEKWKTGTTIARTKTKTEPAEKAAVNPDDDIPF
jgi:hypothetical protein